MIIKMANGKDITDQVKYTQPQIIQRKESFQDRTKNLTGKEIRH